jgi:hypothetical protein
MQHWKRSILNAGVSLSVVGGGILLAEGAASAHDAGDNDGAGIHGIFQHQVHGVVASVGADSFTITTHKGVTKTIDTTSSCRWTRPMPRPPRCGWSSCLIASAGRCLT